MNSELIKDTMQISESLPTPPFDQGQSLSRVLGTYLMEGVRSEPIRHSEMWPGISLSSLREHTHTFK
jgi:hypothetical protein